MDSKFQFGEIGVRARAEPLAERCPPKAEVVSSNLAGCAILIKDIDEQRTDPGVALASI